MRSEEGCLVGGRLEDFLVVLCKLIIRRCEGVKVSTEGRHADDIQSGLVRPLVNLHYFITSFRLSDHAVFHLKCF